MKLTGLLLAILLLQNRLVAAPTLSATNDGVRIEAGTFGSFTLTYPQLITAADKPLEPVEKSASGAHASLRYAGGATVEVTIGADGAVAYAFANPPAGLKNYQMSMLVDFGFREGGKWRMGAGEPNAFPQDKPAKPHLYQGNANTFELTSADGRSIRFGIPAYSYEELTDNREWNWKIYNWMFIAPFDAGNPRGVVTIAGGGAGKPVVVVDRFGQDAAMAFPGKVKSEAELKADVAADEAYFDGLKPPTLDAYGGLPGSKASVGLQATGYFHVERKGERWMLVDPDGNAYFHLGICGFQPGDDYTYVKGRESSYEWLPPYDGEFHAAYHPDGYWGRDTFSFYVANVIRKYGKYDPEENSARMVGRVRKLGFNAVGAFSGITQAERQAHFPWVDILPLGTYTLGGQIEGLRGLFDPFDPQVAAKMDQLFSQNVAKAADEPLLIGYFLDNEQAFEDIPRVIPSLKGTQPAKRKLVEGLQAKYQTVDALNRAWGLQLASFDAARDSGLAVTTQAASNDMAAFTEQFIDAYYSLVAATFHKYDKHHMLLGNRWQPVTANSEPLCRIAGKYCDVLSINYYTYGVDKTFLKRLYDWSGGKPFLLSEFYWSSPAESGLPGGSEVKTQKERGLAYRNYVEQGASTGFVVGIEWFILVDQARTGRFFERYTGEKANTGLFSVTDRIYRDFAAQAMATNYAIYDVVRGKRPPFAYADPRFMMNGAGQKSISIPRAIGAMKLDGKRDGWPGTPPESIPASRLVMGSDPGGFDGSFRACWDDENLYLSVQVNDATPMKNDQRGADSWNGDCIELFVGPEKPDQDGSLLFSDRQVLLNAVGGEGSAFVNHAPQQAPCRVAVIPAVNGKGYLLEAAIPFAALGFSPKDGQTIRFDVGIDDGAGSGRQRQLMWSGGARNSGDRSAWGRARFVK